MTEPKNLLRDLLNAARAFAEAFPLPDADDLTIVLLTGVSTDDADADAVDDALDSISTEHLRLSVSLLEELLDAQEEG